MRFRVFFITLVAAVLAAACVHLNTDTPVFQDEQIGMVMRVANLNEVREGTLAREKAAEPSVRDFATMMVNEHTTANSKTESELFKKEINFSDSPLSKQLDAESGAATESMRALAGHSFDRAYMDRQVKVHQNILDIIDKQLEPHAKNKVVKEQLKAMRTLVEAHLAKAKQVASSIPTT